MRHDRKIDESYRRYDPLLRPRINWVGMLWATFWYVVFMCLIAAAVASTLDLWR